MVTWIRKFITIIHILIDLKEGRNHIITARDTENLQNSTFIFGKILNKTKINGYFFNIFNIYLPQP